MNPTKDEITTLIEVIDYFVFDHNIYDVSIDENGTRYDIDTNGKMIFDSFNLKQVSIFDELYNKLNLEYSNL
ncbi:hypothetical protein KAR50_05750 [Periweissella fabaria]|uniref:Uncharacterized protein n=1 Tax=Periweissella fabaria TaxID=546157 RepID=A0ABN8BEF9_9LACO|nr:hypothetical protein [Periweissella fabaria]MCM0597346.1 hypothetical protein [Periweissella fabaria]CAH0416151.1 hypothetical protein WFA24289_00450 [Periweissella fabaria]